MTIKFSGFTAASAPALADLLVGLQGGANVKYTLTQIAALLGVAKFAANFGDGASVSYTINHALNTRDVQVTVYRASTPWDEVIVDIAHTDANNVTIGGFTTPPALNSLRVVVWA
jgi:ABC-type nitrate/sulfonate/bicarbonate transport system substrate-binding protein